VSVACWLIPFPLESFVKNPVPWALISCQCPSWAITPEAHIRTPRIVATTIFRVIFLFLHALDFLHNDKLDSIKQALLTSLISRRDAAVADSIQCRCLGPITPSGPVKHRNPKIASTAISRTVIMRASFHPRFSHTYCRPSDLARYVSCYRSLAKFSLRFGKLGRRCAPASRAISFFRETSDPSKRQRKFP
jgi:hypothetical protein